MWNRKEDISFFVPFSFFQGSLFLASFPYFGKTAGDLLAAYSFLLTFEWLNQSVCISWLWSPSGCVGKHVAATNTRRRHAGRGVLFCSPCHVKYPMCSDRKVGGYFCPELLVFLSVSIFFFSHVTLLSNLAFAQYALLVSFSVSVIRLQMFCAQSQVLSLAWDSFKITIPSFTRIKDQCIEELLMRR